MAHRAIYPRSGFLPTVGRVLWLIWMTLMTAVAGGIAMLLALAAGFCLFMLAAGWMVDVH